MMGRCRERIYIARVFIYKLVIYGIALAIEAGFGLRCRHWSAFKDTIWDKKLPLESQSVLDLLK